MLVDPNRAAAPDSFGLRLTRGGKPVTGADVTLTFAMLDMQMPTQEYQLAETGSRDLHPEGTGARHGRPLGPRLTPITPKGGLPFSALVVDRAGG